MVVKTLIGSDDTFTPTNSSCSSLLRFYHWSPIDQGWDHSLWSDRRLPLLSKWWKAQQNFVVVDAKNYKEGDQLEDESNGFTYPHAASEMKYTATYDSARGDGSNGAFGEHGFNEAGVSMTSTVTAIPNKKS